MEKNQYKSGNSHKESQRRPNNNVDNRRDYNRNNPKSYHRYPSHGDGIGWGYYYPYYIPDVVYPLIVEMPNNEVIIQNTPSETMQNIERETAKIAFPTKWNFKPTPTECSLIQAQWSDPIEKLSLDPSCYCPVGNKASKDINNQTLYRCQIPFPIE